MLSDILAAEQALYAAQRTSDVEALDRLIADNLLFTGPDGNLYSKQDDIAAHRAGHIHFEYVHAEEPKILMLRDDIGIVAVRVALKARFMGQLSEGVFNYTRVWMLQNGNWQIAAGHVSAA